MQQIDKRCVQLAEYIIESKNTVRQAAKVFGISKSTVHNDITYKLKEINNALYMEVQKVLFENKAQRHIRGGIATKNKYLNIKMGL